METIEFEQTKNPKGKLLVSFLAGIVVGFGGYFIIDEKDIGKPMLARLGIIELNYGNDKDKGTTEGELAGTLGEELGDVLKEGQAAGAAGTDDDDTVKPVNVIVSSDSTLVAPNQPADTQVVMSMVAISESGWVAIHETTEDGALGNILGAYRFEAGKYFGEAIPLLRGTKENKTYIAVLHADDGNGEFDFKREVPVRTTEGGVVETAFVATSPSNQ